VDNGGPTLGTGLAKDSRLGMIVQFTGEFSFLSNFHLSEVEFEGIVYPSVEHAYQAAKTKDPNLRMLVAQLDTPGKAKRAGRRLVLRSHWEEMKLEIMEQLVRQKFSKDPFRQKLLDTGDEQLTEGNWWGDTFWGVCNGDGQNHLGKILMKVREELKGA
jgi:hypothetical protein